jgi:hypothetical protein
MAWETVKSICKQHYKQCDNTCPLQEICKRRGVNTREQLDRWEKDLEEQANQIIKGDGEFEFSSINRQAYKRP